LVALGHAVQAERVQEINGRCRERVKMSGLRRTSNVRSGADALWAG
jgi:hypothetical protein